MKLGKQLEPVSSTRSHEAAAVECSVQTAARVRGSCDARSPERASEEAHRVRERREKTREERARGMAR